MNPADFYPQETTNWSRKLNLIPTHAITRSNTKPGFYRIMRATGTILNQMFRSAFDISWICNWEKGVQFMDYKINGHIITIWYPYYNHIITYLNRITSICYYHEHVNIPSITMVSNPNNISPITMGCVKWVHPTSTQWRIGKAHGFRQMFIDHHQFDKTCSISSQNDASYQPILWLIFSLFQ